MAIFALDASVALAWCFVFPTETKSTRIAPVVSDMEFTLTHQYKGY